VYQRCIGGTAGCWCADPVHGGHRGPGSCL